MNTVLVSSCLLGLPARYNGQQLCHGHPVLRRWQAEGRLLAFCPELAGGLAIPRPPAEVAAGQGGVRVLAGQARVIELHGNDVTEAFVRGARAAQELVRERGIRLAVLKDGSPSCGSTYSYDGSFSSRRLALPGVSAAALQEVGVQVFSELNLDAAADWLRQLEN